MNLFYILLIILDEIIINGDINIHSVITNNDGKIPIKKIGKKITKKYGFAGNIPTDLHEIGKVMGFNFKDDLVKTLKDNGVLTFSEATIYLLNIK